MKHTINGPTYLDMLELYAVPQLPRDVIFQKDGTPCHYAEVMRDFLYRQFPRLREVVIRFLDPLEALTVIRLSSSYGYLSRISVPDTSS